MDGSSEKLSPNVCFQDELTDSELGVSLKVCYNCSTCTTACPVALETEGKFNPRTIIQLANCGYEERLILENNPNVWQCTMCEVCQEVCPQNVDLHEIFLVVKNTAARYENIPENYTAESQKVFQFGKSIPLQSAIEKRRTQLELPVIPPVDVEEIQTLLNMTEMKDILGQHDKKEVK
jgi:heterodisulfide reductase subunit C